MYVRDHHIYLWVADGCMADHSVSLPKLLGNYLGEIENHQRWKWIKLKHLDPSNTDSERTENTTRRRKSIVKIKESKQIKKQVLCRSDRVAKIKGRAKRKEKKTKANRRKREKAKKVRQGKVQWIREIGKEIRKTFNRIKLPRTGKEGKDKI